jgi:g-D-glutamyl-meso-diaminopimelate peptidase
VDIYQKTTAFFKAANTEKRIYGKSLSGRNLYGVKLGEGNPVGIAIYAIHGREYITAELAFHHYARGVYGSIWLLPLANPDGALISERGISSVESREQKELLSKFTAEEHRLWKANGRGVDLNVNFAADFGKGVRNTTVRGGENCIGDYPFSEVETQSLRDFTLSVAPDYTISYHTKGEEIYWYYHQPLARVARDKRLAVALAASCGYPLRYAKGSVGGYKDWCVQTLKIPAFTVEVGRDELTHPLQGKAVIDEITLKNGGDLLALSKAVKEYKEV